MREKVKIYKYRKNVTSLSNISVHNSFFCDFFAGKLSALHDMECYKIGPIAFTNPEEA